MRTDEIGDEEEDILRVSLRGGEVDRNFWVDDLDGLVSTAVCCFAHHRVRGRGCCGGMYVMGRKGEERDDALGRLNTRRRIPVPPRALPAFQRRLGR